MNSKSKGRRWWKRFSEIKQSRWTGIKILRNEAWIKMKRSREEGSDWFWYLVISVTHVQRLAQKWRIAHTHIYCPRNIIIPNVGHLIQKQTSFFHNMRKIITNIGSHLQRDGSIYRIIMTRYNGAKWSGFRKKYFDLLSSPGLLLKKTNYMQSQWDFNQWS